MLSNEEVAAVQETNLPPTTITSFIGSSGSFADSDIVLPDAPVQSFAQRRLNTLFESEISRIEGYTDEHWKTPEFPLARIKKIMRIDEDVKMISGEVPVLLSKAIELFVTELTLRSWMLTEDSKRRTVQRSDIAMAIAKNDMFDFLIDIVPREEINSRNRSDAALNSSILSPELLQLYLQLLSQHTETQAPLEEGGSKKAPLSNDAKATDSQAAIQQTLATNAILQQQIQLIQQIAQLQQQISKTPITSVSSANDVVLQPTLPSSSVSYTSPSLVDHSQNFRSVTTTAPSCNSGLQDTLAIGNSSTDLLLPSSLAPVTPFLSELTASAQFSSLPTSSSTVSELTGPNVQRFVINPGGFNVEQSGLHNLSSSSAAGGQSALPLSSLSSVSSGEFGTDMS